MYEHWTVFFAAHTQNGKRAEFDKKCIGLESPTTPLNLVYFAESNGKMYEYLRNARPQDCANSAGHCGFSL